MTAAALLGDFHAELALVQTTHDRTIDLQYKGSLTLQDLEYIVAALALHVCASFEHFLNELFLAVLSGQSGLQHVGSHITPAASPLSREILYGRNDATLRWLPLGELSLRAARFLPFGQPFSRLEFRNLDPLDDLRVVRNRIAHHGEKARLEYERQIMRGDMSFARPARWLIHEPVPGQADHLIRIVDLLAAVSTVVASDAPDIDGLLGPSLPAEAGRKAPPGRYQCSVCFHEEEFDRGGLPLCAVCTAAGRKGGGPWKLLALLQPV